MTEPTEPTKPAGFPEMSWDELEARGFDDGDGPVGLPPDGRIAAAMRRHDEAGPR